MVCVKDFTVSIVVEDINGKQISFETNMWAGQEIFRRLFGPGTGVKSCDIVTSERVVGMTDPINWDHPVCCDHCRKETEERKAKKQLNQSLLINTLTDPPE